jgi:hypothetical protein
MGNQRSSERRPNRRLTKVFDLETGICMGRLANISTGGMMLITNKPYENGDRFQVSIQLGGVAIIKTELEAEVEVRWCKRDANPRFWAVGFKFQDLAFEDLMIIEQEFQGIGVVG